MKSHGSSRDPLAVFSRRRSLGWAWLRGREKDGNAVDEHGNAANDPEVDFR